MHIYNYLSQLCKTSLIVTTDADTDPEMMTYPKIQETKPAYAVIINNQKFDDKKLDRKGAKKDVDKLRELDKMNIKLEHVLTDLTAGEMVGALTFLATRDASTEENQKGALKLLNIPEKKLQKFNTFQKLEGYLPGVAQSQLKGFDDYSCLMVFILTHGSDDGILLGKDSSTTTVKDLAKIFNSKQCEDLKGKPKMFFIQACRGGDTLEADDTVGKDHDNDDDREDNHISCKLPYM